MVGIVPFALFYVYDELTAAGDHVPVLDDETLDAVLTSVERGFPTRELAACNDPLVETTAKTVCRLRLRAGVDYLPIDLDRIRDIRFRHEVQSRVFPKRLGITTDTRFAVPVPGKFGMCDLHTTFPACWPRRALGLPVRKPSY